MREWKYVSLLHSAATHKKTCVAATAQLQEKEEKISRSHSPPPPPTSYFLFFVLSPPPSPAAAAIDFQCPLASLSPPLLPASSLSTADLLCRLLFSFHRQERKRVGAV